MGHSSRHQEGLLRILERCQGLLIQGLGLASDGAC